MQRVLALTFTFALLLATTPGSPALAARPSDACLEQLTAAPTRRSSRTCERT